MKRYIGLAATVVLGGVALCSAQDTKKTDIPNDTTGSEIAQEAAPWRISGGLVYKNWLTEHDALQQRVPSTVKTASDWENGSTQGSGWGLQTRINRGDGTLNVSFEKSQFNYELWKPSAENPTFHQTINTTARDFEPTWSQVHDRTSQAEWGSTLGFRYLGMQKDDAVTEGTKPTVEAPFNVNWLMLVGGYYGNWRPFETPVVQAHGSILFFLGEAKGNARMGMDTNSVDGVISETYPVQYSLAYGARGSFGVDVALTKRTRITIDYMREWLYSFDSTDTGIVVFPDNNDALFIENHSAVVASLNYLF